MMYDFIIIGGGLSGLLSLERLLHLGYTNILLLEQDDHLGGRIHTHLSKKPYQTWMDCGAARISSSQKHTMKLLKRLQLNHLLNELPDTPIGIISPQKWKQVAKELPKNPMKTPAELIQDPEWEKSTGYENDFHVVSASAFQNEWSHYNPSKKTKWFDLDGGLNQIIEKLTEKLPKSKIHIEESFLEVSGSKKRWSVKTTKNIYQTRFIIFALQSAYLPKNLEIPLPNFHQQPLIRVFTRAQEFPNWLDSHPVYYREESQGGQCISFGERTEKTGWFEMFYTAGKYATKLFMDYLNSPEKQIKKYEKQWQKLTNEKIKIDDIKNSYWANGVEWYSPQKNTLKKSLQQLIKFSKESGLFFVGDTYSDEAGWMNGAIKSVEEQPFPTRTQKGGKVYTMKDVAKHNTRDNAWLVIRGKVYNVTKWIPFHPGGDAILAGVGKDATELFEKAHSNLKVPEKILPKYYIGKLKK